MGRHFNRKSETKRRRALRRNLSKAEAVMWTHLSRRQMLGLKFRRQYGVDSYSVDFYCPQLKLAVEIDGETHFRGLAPKNDRKRQELIESYGILFLRFRNEEVLGNLTEVLESMRTYILKLSPPFQGGARGG